MSASNQFAWNSSIDSPSLQNQQLQHNYQSRQYRLEDPPHEPYEIYSQLEEYRDVDGSDIEITSAQQPSSSLSPINYFFNRFAAATIITSESPLIGSSRRIGMSGGSSQEEMDAAEYNYVLMKGLSPAEGSSGVDTSIFPSALPEDGVASIGNSSLLEDNFWAVFDEQYLRHNLGWTITLVVAYTLILIIGIIGNCMVILVVIKRPQMRTVTNMFIMNLAVADLFVIVFCVPATLLSNIFTPWILGLVMCKGVAYVQGVSVCASAYSLAAISLDRCKAIYRPMERPRGLSKSQALFIICLIWTIALLLTIPWAVIFNVVSKKDRLSYCIETWENETHGKIYFLVANLFCCYCLPLILISISNVIIWCHVTHRKVPQDSASASTIKKMHRRTRHGVRKMLGIVTLAFLLSWLPLYVLVTRAKFATNISEWESDLLDILMPLAQWLGSWNSSINPVLYAFLNSKFREMFKSLLPAWVPFVHRNSDRTIMRNNVGRGTITNGTLTLGTTGPASCATVYTGRNSTGRSSNNSRRFHHHKSQNHDNRRTLLVSSFRGDLPTTTTTAIPTALVADGGGGGGNGRANIVMTSGTTTIATSAYVTTTSATITDL